MQISTNETKHFKPSVKRCVLCKTPIRKDSKQVPGLGHVGPDCYKKVASFDLWMKKHKLEDLATGGIVVTAEQIRERSVDHLLKRRDELIKAGFHVYLTPIGRGDFAMTLGKIHTRSSFRQACLTTFAEVSS